MFKIRNGKGLDFEVVEKPLNELLEASANFLERDWPVRYSSLDSARVIFYTRMRLVINTYVSIMWLTADKPKDPRRNMLVLSTPPLVRTLFEELMTLIFIFHDVPALMQSYALTNYTELDLELKHAKKYHMDKAHWENYICGLETRLDELAVTLKLTSDQVTNPQKHIGRWPTPGKMIDIVKVRWRNSPDIEFMEYIRSWIYRTLSGDAHLNYYGVIRRGSFFAGKEIEAEFGQEKGRAKIKENFEAFRMEMIWTMLVLLVSIVSELEGHFRFGLSTKAKYLWKIFEDSSDLAKEFYKSRFEEKLA